MNPSRGSAIAGLVVTFWPISCPAQRNAPPKWQYSPFRPECNASGLEPRCLSEHQEIRMPAASGANGDSHHYSKYDILEVCQEHQELMLAKKCIIS